MRKETLDYFSNLIRERFEQNPENGKHCTEDTVRYLFMSSLILKEFFPRLSFHLIIPIFTIFKIRRPVKLNKRQMRLWIIQGRFFLRKFFLYLLEISMIMLNDYLYNGDTVLKILYKYSSDLKDEAKKTGNTIDMVHCNFLIQIVELLQHNEFLTSQSHRILEFYKFMTQQYPFLAFTLRGRIKSLIRAEEKFNGYIVNFIFDYYKTHNDFPSVALIKEKLNGLRDLIAYRFVISLPKCHLKNGENKEDVETKYLYELANRLPEILEEQGFTSEIATDEEKEKSILLSENVWPYYKDYIHNSKNGGYKSLHITFYDNVSRSHVEVQLRTKDMDDFAEIGPANHLGYEKKQEAERARRDLIPEGKNIYFDQAYERGMKLQQLQLKDLDVNMFNAMDNSLINDGCGLYRGRLILPYEHLSRFQNGSID